MDARRWSSGGAAVLALALLTGCGAAAGSSDSSRSAEAVPSRSADQTELTGTWRTADMPLERVRAVVHRAAVSDAEAQQVLGAFGAATTVAFEIRIDDTHWKQYEHDDGGPALPAWNGTWTADGAVIHAVGSQDGCSVDYRVAQRADQITMTVLDADADRCGHAGEVIQKAIFESAPFSRVG